MPTTKELLERMEGKIDDIDARLYLVETNHLHTIEEKINEIKNRLWLITGVLGTLITGLNGVF